MDGDAPNGSKVRFHARAYDGLRQHTFSKVGKDLDPTVSPDGKLLAFASDRHSDTFDIYVKKTDGRTVTQVTTDPGHDMQPAFSADGRLLAYASNRSGNWDIFVLDLARRKSIQVTDSKQHDVHPSWSPDGRHLVYCSCSARSGDWELWLASIEHPGQKQMIGPGLYPQWHPTTRQVVFQKPRYRGQRWYAIWTVHLVGAEAKYPTEIVSDQQWAAISPSWNADGRRLVFAAVAKAEMGPAQAQVRHASGIYVVDIDGTGLIRLTSGPESNWSPVWASDGRIYFVSDRNNHINVWSTLPVSSVLGR
jgi:TolB protein